MSPAGHEPTVDIVGTDAACARTRRVDGSVDMTIYDHPAMRFMASLVTELGPFWGELATQDQLLDASAVLNPAGGSRRHWLSRARGYSKTTDVAAMTLAAMATGVIPQGGRGYVCAADGDQAALLIDACRGFVQRTPCLAAVFTVERRRIIGPHSTQVVVITSDVASAYGLRGDWWIIDESCQWPDTDSAREFYEAITTAWPKTRTCTAVIITTAGDPGHWTKTQYDHANNSKRWRVSAIPGPPLWVDPEEIAEEKARLPESTFQCMWLNEWAEPEDRLVQREDLDACTRDHAKPITYQRDNKPYLITVDLGLKRDSTVVVVSHRDNTSTDRKIVIDRLDAWVPSNKQTVSLRDVQTHITKLHADYGKPRVLIDPYQAALLREQLQAQTIEVDEFQFTQGSNSELAMSLYTAIRDHHIELPALPTLADELLNVQLKEIHSNVWRIDHAHGRHEDQAITVAMACWWHTQKTPPNPSATRTDPSARRSKATTPCSTTPPPTPTADRYSPVPESAKNPHALIQFRMEERSPRPTSTTELPAPTG